MKYLKAFLVFSISLIVCVSSCKKDKFPGKDIFGKWEEKTTNADKTQIRFETNGIAYLSKPKQPTETFNYSLSDSKELLYFSNEAGESTHQIKLDEKTDELIIWNLFPALPDNLSETVFERK